MSVIETTPGRALAVAADAGAPPKAIGPFGEDGFTFRDFLDIINPLQHIPIVSAIYRHLTGDTIDAGAKMAGDILFGGPLGLAGYVFNTAVAETSGKDPGEHLIALFTGGGASEPAETRMVEAPAAARFDTAAGSGDPESDLAEAKPFNHDERAEFGLLFAAARRESQRIAETRETEASNRPPASGALAAEGGWFTDVMLSALERYRTAAQLAAAGGGLPQPAGAAAGNRFDASY